MTAMDDLLNSSSLVMYPASIVALWQELEPGYLVAAQTTAAESLIQLGQQIGPQGASVTQSFDDGLPDPVTLTASNDAAGSFQMDLVGRPPAVAATGTLGGNGNWSQGAVTASTSFTTTFPTGVAFWDYTFITITVSSATIVTETSMPADSLYAWQLIGDATDTLAGTFQRTWVFGRKHYTSGVVTPAFKLDAAANVAWIMQSVKCGQTASAGVLVPVLPGAVVPFVEGTVAVANHIPGNVTLAGRGWNIAAFGASNAAGAWSAPSGYSIFGFFTSANLSIANVISPFRNFPGSYGISGVTAANAQLVTGVHFAMEVRDRPILDAVGYFSPLNKKSPIYNFERDTAPTTMAINNIALDGNQTETNKIFSGTMTGISISGRTATATALSNTRMLLDDSHELPAVYGWREGLETDWLTGYLLAHGGQYIGIAPSVYTRWWAPLHGSLHPYMDGSACYTESRDWIQGRAGSYRISPPVVDGPFVTGMYAQQLNARTSFINGMTDRTWATDVPGITNPKMNDLITQQNSICRLTFWIRGDVADQTPTAVDSGDPTDYNLFDAWINVSYLGNAFAQWARVIVNANRNFTLQLDNLGVVLTGGDLPADGAWHFVGAIWDYHSGLGKFRRDGFSWTPGGYTNAAASPLAPSETTINNTGGYVNFQWKSHLPVAELQLEAGPELWADAFTRFYPTPLAPSRNATYRPTRQPLAVVAETTPVQGWTTLQSMAESTLSWTRVNELDNMEFLPLTYFGETAQMTVDTLNVLDTNFNAGEIGLDVDPSRTRNVVTVEYLDTRVGSNRSRILEMSTSMPIPIGTSYVTFPLDTPTAETHGAAQWWTSTPSFTKLTASQVSGATALPNENIMSVNTTADGSGSVVTATDVTARIYDWTSNSITVQFINNNGRTLYLANNGQQIPFLRALGYAISYSDGYSTVRDSGSIGKRRERALTTGLDWVHDRGTAQKVASSLVTLLARPRPVVTVTVQGDSRRTPGKLCQIVDATGTAAEGTWRITSMTHRYTGPMYVQDVTLVYVGITGVWDSGTWDDAVWGA
jgi:hypothetical protein